MRGMVLRGEKKLVRIRLKPEYRGQAEQIEARDNVASLRATYYCEYNKKLLVFGPLFRRPKQCEAGPLSQRSSSRPISPLSSRFRRKSNGCGSLTEMGALSKTPGSRTVSRSSGTLPWKESKIQNSTRIWIFCLGMRSMRGSSQNKSHRLRPALSLSSRSRERPARWPSLAAGSMCPAAGQANKMAD